MMPKPYDDATLQTMLGTNVYRAGQPSVLLTIQAADFPCMVTVGGLRINAQELFEAYRLADGSLCGTD